MIGGEESVAEFREMRLLFAQPGAEVGGVVALGFEKKFGRLRQALPAGDTPEEPALGKFEAVCSAEFAK